MSTTTTNPFRQRQNFQNTPRTPQDPNAMDLDVFGTPRPKLMDQLRDQLRKEGKCFRCRQKGHMSRDCTAFDQKPQGTATTSRNPFRPANWVAATSRFDPDTGLPNPSYIAATRFDPETGLPNPTHPTNITQATESPGFQ